jgi:uncharacterized protein
MEWEDKMKKKILIAGGSGLIGQALSSSLLAEGHEVAVLTRDTQGTDLPAGVEAVRWDASTPQGWGERVSRVDAIINLAGANISEHPWTNERKRQIRESRQKVGQAIVAAVQQAQNPPPVVLQIAGVGYYGTRNGDRMLDEQGPPGEDYLSGVSSDWEDAIRPVEASGVRLAILRAGVVLSAEGGVIEPFLLQHRLFAGGPLGSGKQWISWIHMQDLVRVFQFFLEREDARGVFNVTSPNPVTNAEFGRTFGKVMGRPYWLPTPAFALRAVLGEMSTVVLEGQRVIPARLLEMGFQFKYADLQTALEDILHK